MKAIQADSDILKHIQELFRHIQTPVYPDIFRPCYFQNQRHIQNPGIFMTLALFRMLAYSELEAYS